MLYQLASRYRCNPGVSCVTVTCKDATAGSSPQTSTISRVYQTRSHALLAVCVMYAVKVHHKLGESHFRFVFSKWSLDPTIPLKVFLKILYRLLRACWQSPLTIKDSWSNVDSQVGWALKNLKNPPTFSRKLAITPDERFLNNILLAHALHRKINPFSDPYGCCSISCVFLVTFTHIIHASV